MAKILAPNKEYTGVSASVTFVNGVGESDNPALVSWFKEHGYQVEEKATQSEEKPLSKMKKDELIAVAAKMELEVPDGASNADLVKLIEAARG